MESLNSFPVGLFHPLQHAGLSRRSADYRQYGTYNGTVMTLPDWRQSNRNLQKLAVLGLEERGRLFAATGNSNWNS
jgi:hypothetical protein